MRGYYYDFFFFFPHLYFSAWGTSKLWELRNLKIFKTSNLTNLSQQMVCFSRGPFFFSIFF